MTETTVRALIYSLVAGVSNAGQVHDYERWSRNWTDFFDHFKTSISGNDVIRGWTVTCAGWTQDYGTRRYIYKIRGYFGLDDSAASEKTAIGIAEDVCEALNTSSSFDEGETADLTIFEMRMFGSVLCHYVEITFKPSMVEKF